MGAKLKRNVVVLVFTVSVFTLLIICMSQKAQSATIYRDIATTIKQSENMEFNRIIKLTNPRMEGQDILSLQNHLVLLGFNELESENGYYGQITEGIIKIIQSFFGFNPNGEIDKDLWDCIFDNNNNSFLQDIHKAVIASAHNESDFKTDGKGTITEYIYKDNTPFMIIIPAQINGEPITAIESLLFACCELTGVIIPHGVTHIGYRAFAGEKSELSYITIPSSVVDIGSDAFGMRNSVKRVTIGANVNVWRIESGLYDWYPSYIGFANLYNVNGKKAGTYIIKDGDWNLNGETIMDYDKYENGFTMDAEGTITAYDGDKTSLVIPDEIGGVEVNAIGAGVFKGKGITSVTISDNITRIDNDAFRNNLLTSVTIPNSVADIGYCAFRGNKLTSITIGSQVHLKAFLGEVPPTITFSFDPYRSFDNCFDDCYNDFYRNGKAGTYENNNNIWSLNGENIAAYTQYESGFFVTDGKNTITRFIEDEDLERINRDGVLVIPAKIGGETITAIGSCAFLPCIYHTVIIPESVTSIGFNAFEYDPDLTSFSNSINSISIGANVTLDNSFPYFFSFDEFYNTNGKKAGTYVYSDEQWSLNR